MLAVVQCPQLAPSVHGPERLLWYHRRTQHGFEALRTWHRTARAVPLKNLEIVQESFAALVSTWRTSNLTNGEAELADSDQHLLLQFRDTGRSEFLEELLRRHLKPVRGLVFQMLLDHAAADDVTQDVFLRVVRGIDRFEGRAEFSTWLFQIAMNAARTFLKQRGQARVEFRDALPDGAAVATDRPDGPALLQELTTEVQTAMAQLSPQLRAAVVLVCLQKQPAAVAAEIEGCSTDTMYWRVHEARRQLKQLLAEHLS